MEDTIEGFRSNGIMITNEELESVRILCHRKMEICKIENPEEYMNLLFPGELRNYLVTRSINEASIVMMGGK